MNLTDDGTLPVPLFVATIIRPPGYAIGGALLSPWGIYIYVHVRVCNIYIYLGLSGANHIGLPWLADSITIDGVGFAFPLWTYNLPYLDFVRTAVLLTISPPQLSCLGVHLDIVCVWCEIKLRYSLVQYYKKREWYILTYFFSFSGKLWTLNCWHRLHSMVHVHVQLHFQRIGGRKTCFAFSSKTAWVIHEQQKQINWVYTRQLHNEYVSGVSQNNDPKPHTPICYKRWMVYIKKYTCKSRQNPYQHAPCEDDMCHVERRI